MLDQALTRVALALFVCAICAVRFVAAAEPVLATQTSNQAGVKVTVAPRGFANEARTWDFEITLETHTQTLGDDLTKSAVLLANGKPYLPVGWEGAPPGGHHRKGILRFRAITPRPSSVELQIRRSGEAKPRNFQWELN